jgi:hypothetical protein
VPGDGMERHGEGVGEHGLLVGDLVGHRDQHRVVGRHQFRVATGRVARDAGVDAGRQQAVGEAPAEAVVTGLAGGAHGRDASRAARQPGVEHDPLPHREALRFGAELDDVGHDLVAHHLREGTEAAHGVVAVALTEVEQDLLGIRTADAGEAGAGDDPVGREQTGLIDLLQRDRRHGEVLEQRWRVVRYLVRIGFHAEHECLHRRDSTDVSPGHHPRDDAPLCHMGAASRAAQRGTIVGMTPRSATWERPPGPLSGAVPSTPCL